MTTDKDEVRRSLIRAIKAPAERLATILGGADSAGCLVPTPVGPPELPTHAERDDDDERTEETPHLPL